MRRTYLAVLASAMALVGFSAISSFGQTGFNNGFGNNGFGNNGGGHAITADGDILLGEAAFMRGAGLGNLYNAQAVSINTDTMIRLNEYIWESIQVDNSQKAARRAADKAMRLKNYSAIRDRVLNDPNQTDMMKGDALNTLFDELASPKFAPSSYRLNSFKLDSGLVRKIPFLFAEKRATIAMSRLNKWPIALRGADFSRERRNYELNLDKVLALQLDKKTTREPLLALGKAIQDLDARLDEVIPPENDTLYKDANLYIDQLKRSQDLMKSKEIEMIIGEIDRYSGTTIHDLVEFMRAYKLRFGVPEIGDERKAYPKIYAALKEQLDELKDATARDGKAINPDGPAAIK